MRNEILFTLSKFYLYCLDPFVTWVCLKIPKCVKTSAECRLYYYSLDSFLDFPASRWFQHKGTGTAIKCLSGYTFRPAEALTPEGAVYTDSVALGLCFLRDAIPFSASSRVWETQRKITEYRRCALMFVNKSLRWRHRLTVYATAEGPQRRPLPISKIVQTIVILVCL